VSVEAKLEPSSHRPSDEPDDQHRHERERKAVTSMDRLSGGALSVQ
jgi:hypothetical protein